ncbi:hypothetical protein PG988_004669 [Apiospora saccharicola]
MLDILYSLPAYAALGTALLISTYVVYCALLPKPIPGIPYHHASAARILGDAPAMVYHAQKHGTVFDWMAKQADELNSPIFQLFLKPFSRPSVFITDPREAQDILLHRTKEFDRSQFFQDVFGGTVPHCHVIQPTNDKFRKGRRLLADTMATPFLHNVAAPIIHRHALTLLDLWRVKKEAAAGHAFWVADDLSSFALDSIWDVAFGSQLNTLSEQIAFLKGAAKLDRPDTKYDAIHLPKPSPNAAADSMRILTHGLDVAVTSPTPRLSHWLLRMTPSYRRALAYKEWLVQGRLDDAKARLLDKAVSSGSGSGSGSGAGANDDLKGITCTTDHMVRRESQAARKEGRAPQYDSRQAKDELFGFLVGGYDTTATTMMWSIKFLADHPRVQHKLRAVLARRFEPDDGSEAIPTPDQITGSRIPYLDAVVEEVIRCAQTASSATRMTLADNTPLLGRRLPRGVDVYMLSNGPGYMTANDLNETIPESARSPSSRESKGRAVPAWAAAAGEEDDDMAAFRPERWLKTDASARGAEEVFDVRAGPSMQFGAGLRGCFGKRLAYLEIRILIVVLLWSFELQAVPEGLRGYEAFDSLTHKPKKCYAILQEPSRAQSM